MAHRVGMYFAVLQLFFALTWTVYVIYLPRLAEQVGIPKSWVLWILLLDQLVFVVADWLMGVYADRMAKVLGSLGPRLARLTLLSALAFVLLPFVAPLAGPLPFLMLILLWTATSSALRAPPLVLLDKYASHSDSRWMSGLWLFGTGMAGALAPILTVVLRDADARAPFVLSSIAVALSAWALSWAERTLAARPRGPAAPPARRIPIPVFLLLVLLTGLGYQIHSMLNSPPQYLRFVKPQELVYLTPLFWIGFNLCVLPMSLVLRRIGELQLLCAGAALGAAAAWFASGATSIGALVAAQLAAGAAWAAVMFGAFSTALALGYRGREGFSSGGMFSMFALAAVVRIAVVALALNQDAEFRALLVHAPALLWAAAALLLAGLLYARRAKRALA